MDPILEDMLETVRREAARRPDEHISDDVKRLVDLASLAIHDRNYGAALRALEGIKEVADALRKVVPSSGELVQKTIKRVEEQQYIHHLEVVAFAHTEGLRNNRQLIEERHQMAEDMDEFLQEAIKLSIAHLDPQPVR